MITDIEIRDFAIIKDLSLELFPGLNIITGETGAGKSVIIEAVSMALGARADTDYVRRGCEKAVISITAQTDGLLDDELEELGVPTDDPVIIRREISASGRSSCRINSAAVPLSALTKICSKIADIHGQYDNQYLLDPARHLEILDLYGGKPLAEVKAMTKDAYRKYSEASAELMSLRKKIAENARQKDLLSFELSEIRALNVRSGEDDELSSQISYMQNAEKIFMALSDAYERLYAGDVPAVSSLGKAVNDISSVSEYSEELSDIYERLNNSYYELEDAANSLRTIRDSSEYSQEDLDRATERLDEINTLKRKFGGSIEAVLKYADEAEKSLADIENADERQTALERKISLFKEEYDVVSARLGTLRKDTAEGLQKKVAAELSELNFENAEFAVRFEQCPASGNGNESAEFLISANRGESLKPLAKVASGGELSRIMLALKRIIGDLDRIPTMIFDEIDSGISGAAADVVGQKLREIAQNHQIVCITHLPQIAAKADHNYRIEKHSDEISTESTVVPLSEEERTEEIARLLSGSVITDTARLAAGELLKR